MAAIRIQFAMLAAAAIALIAAEGRAQYGTPLNLRVMTPTIRDADPGVAPAPGAESKLDPAYRHQMVLCTPARRQARSSSISLSAFSI